MKRTLKKLILNENGSVIMYVLVVFVVLMVIIGGLSVLFNANLKQAKYQEDRIKAYYIAQSGIEVAMASLLQKNAANVPFKDEIIRGYSQGPKELLLDNGKASITISGLPSFNAAGHIEIEIESVGILNNSNVTYTLTLIIDATNPEIQRWN